MKGNAMQFSAPVSGSVLKPAELEGHLLIVEPEEFIEAMPTTMGVSDAIRVTVHDVTEGQTAEGVLWFNKVLTSGLKPRIGERVLAVMGKGTAKPGQSAPWILIDASQEAEAVKAATAYLESLESGQFASVDAEIEELAEESNNPALAAALNKLGAKK